MPIELRIGENEQDAVLTFKAYKAMHDEGLVPGSFDPVKTLRNVLRMVKEPGACVLMVMDGPELAGVLSLYEDGYWWSHDTHLTDKGLFIYPDYRDGEAFAVLMEAAARTSDDLGLPVFITVFNGRRKRGGRSKWERVGATLGYDNRGATIAHYPEK